MRIEESHARINLLLMYVREKDLVLFIRQRKRKEKIK
jgi:hypothetical protein